MGVQFIVKRYCLMKNMENVEETAKANLLIGGF